VTITEILDKVHYITDAQGDKKAAVVEFALWQKIVERLKVTTHDVIHVDESVNIEIVSAPDFTWTEEDEADEQRWGELFSQRPEVLERLADEARAERRAGRTKELDPDKL
jgi:hypothetical protein